MINTVINNTRWPVGEKESRMEETEGKSVDGVGPSVVRSVAIVTDHADMAKSAFWHSQECYVMFRQFSEG